MMLSRYSFSDVLSLSTSTRSPLSKRNNHAILGVTMTSSIFIPSGINQSLTCLICCIMTTAFWLSPCSCIKLGLFKSLLSAGLNTVPLASTKRSLPNLATAWRGTTLTTIPCCQSRRTSACPTQSTVSSFAT